MKRKGFGNNGGKWKEMVPVLSPKKTRVCETFNSSLNSVPQATIVSTTPTILFTIDYTNCGCLYEGKNDPPENSSVFEKPGVSFTIVPPYRNPLTLHPVSRDRSGV